jgi:bacteriocin-like protein
MAETSAVHAAPELEVLSDEELADVIGGDTYETMNNAYRLVMRPLGGCECGVGH